MVAGEGASIPDSRVIKKERTEKHTRKDDKKMKKVNSNIITLYNFRFLTATCVFSFKSPSLLIFLSSNVSCHGNIIWSRNMMKTKYFVSCPPLPQSAKLRACSHVYLLTFWASSYAYVFACLASPRACVLAWLICSRAYIFINNYFIGI